MVMPPHKTLPWPGLKAFSCRKTLSAGTRVSTDQISACNPRPGPTFVISPSDHRDFCTHVAFGNGGMEVWKLVILGLIGNCRKQ